LRQAPGGNFGSLISVLYSSLGRQTGIGTGGENERGRSFSPPEKEPKRAVFIAVVGLAMSVFVRVRGRGTDLADAPAKAMLRIWRYARRRCWIFPLFGTYPHALRSGCCADGDWYAT